MNNKAISSGLIAVALGITSLAAGPRNPLPNAGSAVFASASNSSRNSKQPGPGAPSRQFRQIAAKKPNAAAGSPLRLPLDFEANQGQAPPQYAYVAHGPSYALALSSTQIALSLHHPARNGDALQLGAAGKLPPPIESTQLGLQLLGANHDALVTGLDQQAGRSNYFLGNDPSKWHTGIPHFSQVKIAGAYPGIDLVFYGDPQQLEYDFVVAPGADPKLIRLNADGVRSTALSSQGNVILRTGAGNVELKRPVAYQEIDGARSQVSSEFRLRPGHVLQLEVGNYDRRHPLIVDPVLLYSVAIGGSSGNQGVGIDVDASGNTYVTGNSCSADFPTTAGNFQNIQSNPAAKTCQDAIVMKLDPTAKTLIYSDFVGGTGNSSGGHLAVDASGDVFVTGATNAKDFPLISNIGPQAPVACGISSSGNICPDGFVFKLNPDGSSMIFSSLLGGSQASGGLQLKLNPVTGDVVVLGATNSSDFKPAMTTLETAYAGGACANGNPCFNTFLLGLDPSTGSLRYGSFLGGAGNEWSAGLAFDTGGNIYVAGSTEPPLSTSLGPVTHTYSPSGATAGGYDIFVAQLKLAQNALSPGYLTLIQGENDDAASGIAVDSSGNVYLSGSTASLHLPVTPGVFQATNNATDINGCLWAASVRPFLPNACGTIFVGELNPGGALSFLTYLGGSVTDWGEAIGVDSTGNIWLTGVTSSPDFPFSKDAYTPNGSAGAVFGALTPFLAEMSNNGTMLPFATTIAANFGQSTDIKIDSNNNVFVTGYASAVPSTPGVYPADPEAYNPLFVQKWNGGAQPALQLSTTSLTFPDTAVGGVSASQTITAQNTGSGALEISTQLGSFTASSSGFDFLESDNCGGSLAANASCVITVTFEPLPPSPGCMVSLGCVPQARSANLLVLNNAASGTQTVTLTGNAGAGAVFSASPNPITFQPQGAGTTSPNTNVLVVNSGDISLNISKIALGGANAADFLLSLTSNGFGPCTNPVGPGLVCQLEVAFSPAAAATGTRTATLNFTDSAADTPQTINLTGTVSATAALDISPVSAFIGPVTIGSTSASNLVSITLVNPSSTANIQVTSLAITGANAGDFNMTPGSCSSAPPFTVAKGTSCFVQVHFNPAAGASGVRVATLTVGTNPAVTGLPTVALQGDAVTNSDPGMSVSAIPNPMNFGSLQVGQSSNANGHFVTISNTAPIPCAGGATTCGGSLNVTAFAAGLSDYTIAPAPGQSAYCTAAPFTIPVGGNCTFVVIFTPASAGSRNTSLMIQSNDPQGTVTVAVFGAGLTIPVAQFLQSSLNFGNSAIGVTSPPQTATLTNTGQSPLTVSTAAASANYAVSANGCTSALAPGATCTVSVTFTPPSAGTFTGTLTLTDNDPFSSQQIVNLTGTGATGPSLLLSPTVVNFGNQPLNALSAPQTVTLTSIGDTAIAFPANGIRTSTDFILQSTTCGTALAPEASCTANIQFKPSIAFLESGTLLVTDNAPGNPQAVILAGTGVQAGTQAATTTVTSSVNPSLSGQSVTFTATVAGAAGSTPAPTGTVTFLDGTNSLGSGALSAAGQATFATSSLSEGPHMITAVYSGDTNYAGSTSAVLTQVVNSASQVSSTVTLTSSANPSSPGQSVTFTATVTGPSGSTSTPTGSVTFFEGTTSLGTGPLNASAVASFSISTLAAGSDPVTAQYSGDANFSGSTSAVLTQTVAAASFSLGVAPSTVSIADGATGTTVVSVTPVAGFDSQVSFACSGLPAYSSCSFSPATVTPSGSAASTTTLSLATNAAAGSIREPNPLNRSHPGEGETFLALVLFGLGGLARQRRKWNASRWPALLSVLLVAGVATALVACGGGGSGGGSGGTATTPAGTSTVTVTATAGSLSKTATFTFTVQ